MSETNGRYVKSKTKCDVVVEEILNMIATGKYKENEKLPPEQYFVDYFGVSRVTIRESFKRLNMLGVISIRQGKGTFVKKMDVGMVMQPLFASIMLDNLSINQIYDARLFVESGTACMAARNRTEEEVKELEELVAEMKSVVYEQDIRRFSQLDITFHRRIGEISDNHILLATYKTIKEVLDNYMKESNLSMVTVRCSCEYHARIVDAIRRKDENQAREKMEEHISLTKRDLIERLNRTGAPKYIRINE